MFLFVIFFLRSLLFLLLLLRVPFLIFYISPFPHLLFPPFFFLVLFFFQVGYAAFLHHLFCFIAAPVKGMRGHRQWLVLGGWSVANAYREPKKRLRGSSSCVAVQLLSFLLSFFLSFPSKIDIVILPSLLSIRLLWSLSSIPVTFIYNSEIEFALLFYFCHGRITAWPTLSCSTRTRLGSGAAWALPLTRFTGTLFLYWCSFKIMFVSKCACVLNSITSFLLFSSLPPPPPLQRSVRLGRILYHVQRLQRVRHHRARSAQTPHKAILSRCPLDETKSVIFRYAKKKKNKKNGKKKKLVWGFVHTFSCANLFLEEFTSCFFFFFLTNQSLHSLLISLS